MRNWFIAFSVLVLSACAAQRFIAPDLEEVRETTVRVWAGATHGSGTVIARNQILTAAHVVRDYNGVEVEFNDGRRAKATVERISDADDAAVLRIEEPAEFAAVIDCAPLRLGERVFTLGNPSFLHSILTEGVVANASPLGAQQAMLPPGMPEPIKPAIMVSADWEGGDSGAGVFDVNGRLRGIVFGGFTFEGEHTNNSFMTPVTVLEQCGGRK
jgi:S1-C subfamily serine protease